MCGLGQIADDLKKGSNNIVDDKINKLSLFIELNFNFKFR